MVFWLVLSSSDFLINVKIKNVSCQKIFFIFLFKTIHFGYLFRSCPAYKLPDWTLAPSFDAAISSSQEPISDWQSPFICRFALFTSGSIRPTSYQNTKNNFRSVSASGPLNFRILKFLNLLWNWKIQCNFHLVFEMKWGKVLRVLRQFLLIWASVKTLF